nr:immunoglobulin heavy chain junction region [Mus musculus]MBK4189560.1 immunoglobulin heavy chain junction region [Mus musculus]
CARYYSNYAMDYW